MKKITISLIISILLFSGSVFADEMTFEEKAEQCVEDYLYIGDLQSMVTVGSSCNGNEVTIDPQKYISIPINLPLENVDINYANPNEYIFVVNVNDKPSDLLRVSKNFYGFPVVSSTGEDASEFVMYKQQFEQVADGDYAVLYGLNKYFYGNVEGKTVIMPAYDVSYYTDKAQSYMASTNQKLLLIQKNDFANMLKKLVEKANKGEMGVHVLSYLPEKVGMQNYTNTMWYIVTGVVSVLCILSSVVIIKKRKNNHSK